MAKSVPAVASSKLSKKEKKQKKLQRKLAAEQANSTSEVDPKCNSTPNEPNLVENLKTILGIPSGSPTKKIHINDSSESKKKRKRDSGKIKYGRESKQLKMDTTRSPSSGDGQSLTFTGTESTLKSGTKAKHRTSGRPVATKNSRSTEKKVATDNESPFTLTSLFGIQKTVSNKAIEQPSSESEDSSDEDNNKATEQPASGSEDSSDEEDVSQGDLKKRVRRSRQEREMQMQQLELELRKAERTRLGSEPHVPQSELEFKELLQRNSASSAIWIQYISFLIETKNPERAHAVARQALSMIPCEEQQERINLWTVLLRLMVTYPSDSSKSVDSVLAEATSNCDDYTILNNMAAIYHENNLLPEAEVLYRKLTKKFYAEPETWVQLGHFLFTIGRAVEARETLTKGLLVLKKKLGVDLTNRFAQMEFKLGSSVKGESMFEALLANFPKRLDVWNVYLDLLIKQKSIEKARNVLSRMASLSMNLQKKTVIFRKWKEFENTHGDQEHRKKANDLMRAFILKAEAELDNANE